MAEAIQIHPEERIKIGFLHNPVRGFLHSTTACLALLLAIDLAGRASPSDASRDPALLLLLSHFGLYLTSSVYHTIGWPPVSKRRLQRIDHAMIYIAVAATVTAVATVALDDWRRPLIILLAWCLATPGVAYKLLAADLHERFSLKLQIFIATLMLPALLPFSARFPGPATWLLLLGAASFTAGAACFATKRPRLWPRVFSFHEVFHACTVVGSLASYVSIVGYVARGG